MSAINQRQISDLAIIISEKVGQRINARWLKLIDAAVYSSIGKQKLKHLAGQGKLVGFSDPDSKRGDWIFDKHSLDEYRLSQAGCLHDKALEILKRM